MQEELARRLPEVLWWTDSVTSEPVLEMLWETTDPLAVLSERFGFPSGSEAVAWLRGVVSRYYGMSLKDCQRIVMSDGNALGWISTSQGRFIAKWSRTPEKFVRLDAISDLTAWLASRGHSVSAPVPSHAGKAQIVVDGASLNVQRVMPGYHLDVTDGAQVHRAGATLARLHADLRAYPQALNMSDVPRTTRSAHELISSWLESDLSHLPHAPLDALRGRVAAASAAPIDAQLVHGDFRAANVLTRGAQVTAVLDFEEMRFDSPIGELARSAVMLGTLFHDWGPVPPQVHDALLKGYESVHPLSGPQRSWWHPLVLWWSLLMVPTSGDDPTGWGRAAERVAHALNSVEER